MSNVCYEYRIERSQYGLTNIFFSIQQEMNTILSFQAINTLPIIIDVLKNIKIQKEEIIKFTIPGYNLCIPSYFDHNYYRQQYDEKTTLVKFSIPIYFGLDRESSTIFLIENLEKLLSNDPKGVSFKFHTFMPFGMYTIFLDNLRNGILL